MDMNQVIEILKIVAIVGLGALSYYLKTYTNINSKVADLIAQAEEMYKDYTKAGEDKMAWCVDWLNDMVPPIFKPILTDEVLRTIVQNVFDSIQDYINVKKVEVAEKINDKLEEIENKTTE